MLVDGLKNRISMSLGAFFRLIDLLLLDNYSKLMMDEKMEVFIYGETRDKITCDQHQVNKRYLRHHSSTLNGRLDTLAYT